MTVTMTPEAKAKLSNTINWLRERFLKDFHNAAESAFRLSVPIQNAGLAEENRVKRERIENWLDEQARRQNGGKKQGAKEIRERYYQNAIKLAAATFLNRIVVIRHMEAIGLVQPQVIAGGWNSPGYKEFREFAPALLKDETEGFSVLFKLICDELSLDLPGLFGDVGITGLFPVPATALRAVIEAFDDEALTSIWKDDTTLGWVYQFWNDPDRKALDDKISNRGKIERHEIAAKTQLFTERYMVEWLLQNSLNNFWLAICRKNDWEPHIRSNGMLDALEKRRQTWRGKREAGEVTPETIMPIESEAEDRWKYWVSQELTDEFITAAPDSIRKLKILDPAVGSGHFLIIAFMFLVAFYKEEAAHRGEEWPEKEIAESIIENNLHGIDLDPRAVQLAAASLWLKAKSFCPEAAPRYMNLVASNLGLASLPDDDPAVIELKYEVHKTTGIPEELTDRILHALKGADYLGSLLKVDEAVDEAIRDYESGEKALRKKQQQGNLFEGFRPEQTLLSFDEAKISLMEKLDRFLEKFTTGQDLGLRLHGEQLEAGVRFIRLLSPGQYHLVVANPPYLGGAKMVKKTYIDKRYPESKADLYSVFLQRGLELVKPFGISAMVTMRGWMFIGDYEKLRKYIIKNKIIMSIADLHYGAFPEMKDVSVTMSVFLNARKPIKPAVFIQPVKSDLVVRDLNQIHRNISGLMAPYNMFLRTTKVFKLIEGKPLIYWWEYKFLKLYADTPKLGDQTEVRVGLQTGENVRFLRKPWEISQTKLMIASYSQKSNTMPQTVWVPYTKGAAGRLWFETISDVLRWYPNLLEVKLLVRGGKTASRPQNQRFYFRHGISYSTIGSKFFARCRRFQSVFDVSGASVFPKNVSNTLCLMNSDMSSRILTSLNPTVNFQTSDVKRLPLFSIKSADDIFDKINSAFTEHESTRETSIEFKQAAPSPWNYAQNWALKAINCTNSSSLPEYEPVYEDPPPQNYVSYAIGISMGRFGANGEGILNEAPSTSLPHGILYLSSDTEEDSLAHPSSLPVKKAWKKHGEAIAKGMELMPWLMEKFFKDVHLNMYEKRPIYLPLSSKRKNFVAFISIHRWADHTLKTLMADYLIPELKRLDGELQDLMNKRNERDKQAQAEAENRYAKAKALYEELNEFVNIIRQCAEKGPPQAKSTDTPREIDAPYEMDLDDGVMINSAALWPLLEAQWKDPQKWWSELCNAKGRKDYDWSHLAARYFPKRVDQKCQKDPSLAVAHGCFWRYHPAKAYQWELRLQDEIEPWFTIDEKNSDDLAAAFEEDHRQKAEELIEAECRRRERNRLKSEAMENQDSANDATEENGMETASLFAEGEPL